MTQLGRRFEQALVYAAQLHAAQKRKGTDAPYVSHVLSVAGLVLENGGDEDEAIAALLHDAAEDQGGEQTLAAIRQQFGERVAGIVAECSDTLATPKPPWRERKEAYVAHVPNSSASARLVSLADKVVNMRSILADFRAHGDDIWRRFSGGRNGTLWYYRALAGAHRQAGGGPLAGELDRLVTEIETLAGGAV